MVSLPGERRSASSSVFFIASWRQCWRKMYYFREAVRVQNKHGGTYILVGTLVNETLRLLSVRHLERAKCFWMVLIQRRCVPGRLCGASGMFLEAQFQRAAPKPDSVSVFCLGLSWFFWMRLMAGREGADIFIKYSLCFDTDVEMFGIKTITHVPICCALSLFLLFPPLRSPTGSLTPGGGWRTRWDSRTWAGRSGSNSTTNMFRATQSGSASAATTAAQKVRGPTALQRQLLYSLPVPS